MWRILLSIPLVVDMRGILRSILECFLYFYLFVGFDNISLVKVVEALDIESTIESKSHFLYIVFENA